MRDEDVAQALNEFQRSANHSVVQAFRVYATIARYIKDHQVTLTPFLVTLIRWIYGNMVLLRCERSVERGAQVLEQVGTLCFQCVELFALDGALG